MQNYAGDLTPFGAIGIQQAQVNNLPSAVGGLMTGGT
jgi:hypothetical protein